MEVSTTTRVIARILKMLAQNSNSKMYASKFSFISTLNTHANYIRLPNVSTRAIYSCHVLEIGFLGEYKVIILINPTMATKSYFIVNSPFHKTRSRPSPRLKPIFARFFHLTFPY